MFELVPLWMVLVFGVVAAVVVEAFIIYRESYQIQYYRNLAADRMAEIADVRQANIELRHKVDEYKDQRQRLLKHIDEMHQTIARYRSELQKAKANEYIETIARYRNELRDANAKIDEYRLQMIADLQKIEDQGKQIRDLRAQVEMHRTNAAKAQDEVHRLNLHYNRLDAHLDDANEYLAACTESIVYTFQEIKNVRKEYKPPLAPVDSRLAGAGSVDGDAEPGSCGDGELPQVCS